MRELEKQRESSEVVKDRILKASRELFAEYGIKGVSIRKIAAEAGINHALVIRYFGSKSVIVNQILRDEIEYLTGRPSEGRERSAIGTLIFLRNLLLNSLTNQRSAMKLIVRAGLEGLFPEKLVGENSERAAGKLASWIESRQTGDHTPDAKLTSVVIFGALFSLVSISPWLMTSVALPPEDYEQLKEDIVDVIMWIIVQSVGMPPDTVDLLKEANIAQPNDQ